MEWDGGTVWRIALGIFFLLSGAGVAYALFRLGGTFNRVNSILKNVEVELPPLLTRVETTLDEVNSELDKVNQITGSVAAIMKVAESVTTAVHNVAAVPLKKLSELVGGVVDGVKSFGGAKKG